MAVGRFQVMATLQAARAVELGLPLESAESWGLNRAIFYAAAKRGFRGKSTAGGGGVGAPSHKPSAETPREYMVGDEKGYTTSEGRNPLFVIGGKAQTPEDFGRQISARFNGKFDAAWEDAQDYVRHFDHDVLASGQEFFSLVYRPKRDEFAAKWTELAEGSGGPKSQVTKAEVAKFRKPKKKK